MNNNKILFDYHRIAHITQAVLVVKFVLKDILETHLLKGVNHAHAHLSQRILPNHVKSILMENLYVVANKVIKGACVISKC